MFPVDLDGEGGSRAERRLVEHRHDQGEHLGPGIRVYLPERDRVGPDVGALDQGAGIVVAVGQSRQGQGQDQRSHQNPKQSPHDRVTLSGPQPVLIRCQDPVGPW